MVPIAFNLCHDILMVPTTHSGIVCMFTRYGNKCTILLDELYEIFVVY